MQRVYPGRFDAASLTLRVKEAKRDDMLGIDRHCLFWRIQASIMGGRGRSG
jgi:hypothetical protein